MRIPVVIVSAEDEGVIGALDVDDHLRKPLDSARLDRWLARLVVSGGPIEAASG